MMDVSIYLARQDKRGKIDDTLPPILKRLNIEPSTWQDIALNFESAFGPWASSEQQHRKPRLKAGSG